ncbi:MAG: GAF domain-containing protein, partial [Oscillatoriales cyanobacterium SM2_2_1]|nr:GAF domain-containing protein [Oscillatoriales cyanobacterium SM2_2_1]
MVDLSLPMAIADARNPKHPLIWVNAAFSKITGLPSEQLLHRSHPLVASDPDSPYPEVRSWLCADGAVRWYQRSCHTQADEDGARQLIITFSEVTALIAQLELYRAVVDHHPAMVIVSSQNGHIELSNTKAGQLLGWPLKQMTTPDVLRAAYPNLADLEAVNHALTGACGEWRDVQIRTGDGRMIETRWVNVCLDHGRRLSIGQDVAAQQWQWRSTRLLHQIIGDIPHLSRTDLDTFLAQTAKHLVEAFQVERCVIRLFTEVGLVPFVSHPNLPCLLSVDHPLWQVLFNHEGVLVLGTEAQLPSVQSLMAVAIRAQGKTYGAITLKFCQHPYSWQPRERQLLESIAALLGMALAYRESLCHEQELGQVKMDFLSLISHELRTPMNGVLAMSDLLLSSALTASQRQQLQVLRSSGETLLNILRDMLDLARLEVKELGIQSQPMVLREWLTEFLAPFHQAAQLKGLDFSITYDASLPTQIDSDPTRLGQIFANLLSNALHSTEQGHIALRLEPYAPERLMVTVRDTSAGIAPTLLAEVFDPLVPTHLRSREGVALSLAIAKNLVQRLGGTLWAQSGSTVVGHPPCRLAAPRRGRVTYTTGWL